MCVTEKYSNDHRKSGYIKKKKKITFFKLMSLGLFITKPTAHLQLTIPWFIDLPVLYDIILIF